MIIIFSSAINLRERFAFPHSAKLMASKQFMKYPGKVFFSCILASKYVYLLPDKMPQFGQKMQRSFPCLVERSWYASTPLMGSYGSVSLSPTLG